MIKYKSTSCQPAEENKVAAVAATHTRTYTRPPCDTV